MITSISVEPEFLAEIEEWISKAVPAIFVNFYSLKIDRRKAARVAVKHGLKSLEQIHDFWRHVEIAAKAYSTAKEIREAWASGHKNVSQRENVRRELAKIISGKRKIENWVVIFDESSNPIYELLRAALRIVEVDLMQPNSKFGKLEYVTIEQSEFGLPSIAIGPINKAMENREFRKIICDVAFEILAPDRRGRKSKTEVREFARIMIFFAGERLCLSYEKCHEIMDAVTPLEVFLKDCSDLLDAELWRAIKSFLIKNNAPPQ